MLKFIKMQIFPYSLKFNKIGGLGDRLKQTNYNKTKVF